MFWTCPGHYKVHVHGRDGPGRPVHGYCPVPLPILERTIHRFLPLIRFYSISEDDFILKVYPNNTGRFN